MAWNAADETVVANDGSVSFAPVGTTLPQPGDDPTAALAAAFVGAGFLTEDGPTLSVGQEVTDFGAWQSLQPIRRAKQSQNIQYSFVLQQWNEETAPFAFGGGEVVDEGGGLFSYQFPAAEDALDERSLVVDAIDGDEHYRFVFPRGTVSETVESQFNRTSTAQLPITYNVLAPEAGGAPGWFLTDAAGFAAGS